MRNRAGASEDEPNWMNPSSRDIFERSDNPILNSIGEEPEEEPEAEFKDGEVCIGWKLADKKDFEQYQKRARPRTDSENEAIRYAIRQVAQKVENTVAEDGNEVWIDRSEPDVLFIAGERGSGKSFFLRAITNRSSKTDTTQIIVDIENEFYTNNDGDGIQKDLMKLRIGEDRQNIDTKVLMPEFVYQAREEAGMPERGYRYMTRFKFDFQILDANSIKFILESKFDKHPDFQSFTNRLDQELQESKIQSWQDMKDLAMKMQEEAEFTYNRRGTQIKNYIQNNYESIDFLGVDQKIDLAEILNEHDNVALVMHDGGMLNDDLKLRELYLSFLIKEVRKLKEQGKIDDQVCFNLEEAHKMIPSHTDPEYPPSKQQVRQVIKQDRKRGLSVTMVSQEPTDVQRKNFLTQTKHMLVPQNIKPTPRKFILKQADLWRSGDSQRSKWSRIMDKMPKYTWMYINTETGYWAIIDPCSPLAKHRRSD